MLYEVITLSGRNFEKAVRAALAEVRGAYAVAIICEQEPDKLIA